MKGELIGISIEGLYNIDQYLETGFSAALCLRPLLQLRDKVKGTHAI